MGTEPADLTRETKYSLVKNIIPAALSPTKVYNGDAIASQFEYATLITDGSTLNLITNPIRAKSGRASSPASESSPRPDSSLTPGSARSRNSLSSHLEPSETESIRNFGEEEEKMKN